MKRGIFCFGHELFFPLDVRKVNTEEEEKKDLNN